MNWLFCIRRLELFQLLCKCWHTWSVPILVPGRRSYIWPSSRVWLHTFCKWNNILPFQGTLLVLNQAAVVIIITIMIIMLLIINDNNNDDNNICLAFTPPPPSFVHHTTLENGLLLIRVVEPVERLELVTGYLVNWTSIHGDLLPQMNGHQVFI